MRNHPCQGRYSFFTTLTLFMFVAGCAHVANEPDKKPEVRSDTVAFVLTMDGGLGEAVERPPPQQLRVPVAFLTSDQNPAPDSEGVVRSGSVVLHAVYRDGKFVPSTDPREVSRISLSITAAGYQDRARGIHPDSGQYDQVKSRGLPVPTMGPKLPFGLRELVKSPAPPFNEAIYLGDDADFGFIRVDCSAYRKEIPRTCMVTAELTTYLTLSILGLPEAELPDWRDRMVAARALALSLLVK